MKKRIIHIIPSLGYGGAETFLLRLIPYLENKNFVICYFKTEYDKKRIKGLDIKYISLDPSNTSINDYYLFLKLILSLKKNDVIFSWLYISDLIASLLKLFLFWKKFKVIWNVRNSIITKDYSTLSNLSFLLLRKVFMFIPKKIIFNSSNSMKEHISMGYRKEKCLTIYNGYKRLSEKKVSELNEDNFKIAYVARYHPQKNHQLLLDTISTYKKIYNSNFTLFLAGKNIETKNRSLTKIIKELDLENNVILLGLIDQKKVHDLFFNCDITLLLSNYGEGFPNVIAEAMLYGTFPIVTDIGESRLIANKFGRIIPTNSDPFFISSLINEYEKLKTNSFDIWQQKVKECQEFSKQRFSIISVSDEFNNISKNL